MLEGMNIHSLGTIVIALVVIGLILYRQTRERPVKDNPFKLPLILGIVGVVQTVNYVGSVHTVPVGEVVAVLIGFAVAAALAVPRAHSMEVYRNREGVLVRKGGVLTMVLWVVAIGAHIAISVLVPAIFGDGLGHGFGGLDGVTLTIYLAISLGVQGLVTQGKAVDHDRRHHQQHLVG